MEIVHKDENMLTISFFTCLFITLFVNVHGLVLKSRQEPAPNRYLFFPDFSALEDNTTDFSAKIRARNANFESSHKPEDFDIYVEKRDENAANTTLRIKKPVSLGIDDVTQYSGYIDLEEEDKHFFFWFFESRNDPKNSPLILWLNGGPGCSSMIGMFMGIGPSLMQEGPKPVRNPHSWNEHANMLFLDQPANTGFSYSQNSVGRTRDAAKDAYKVLEHFFEQFPEYKNSDFHIAGESYAGHYIPAFGTEILSHPDRSFKLSSLMIGNAIVNEARQIQSYKPMACGEGGYEAVLNAEQCAQLDQDIKACGQRLKGCDGGDARCQTAQKFCNGLMYPIYEVSRSVYDLRMRCTSNEVCFPPMTYIPEFLNQAEVKQAVGAEDIEYEVCQNEVLMDFHRQGDYSARFDVDVKEVLEQDIPVLVFAGDKDYICNWLGNKDWTDQLEWKHSAEYAKAEMKEWNAEGKAAGETKSYGGLTFCRLYNVGHMAGYTEPQEGLNMMKNWIKGQPLTDSPPDNSSTPPPDSSTVHPPDDSAEQFPDDSTDEFPDDSTNEFPDDWTSQFPDDWAPSPGDSAKPSIRRC